MVAAKQGISAFRRELSSAFYTHSLRNKGCETCEQAFLIFTAFTVSKPHVRAEIQKNTPHQSDDQNSENEGVKPVKLLYYD